MVRNSGRNDHKMAPDISLMLMLPRVRSACIGSCSDAEAALNSWNTGSVIEIDLFNSTNAVC